MILDTLELLHYAETAELIEQWHATIQEIGEKSRELNDSAAEKISTLMAVRAEIEGSRRVAVEMLGERGAQKVLIPIAETGLQIAGVNRKMLEYLKSLRDEIFELERKLYEITQKIHESGIVGRMLFYVSRRTRNATEEASASAHLQPQDLTDLSSPSLPGQQGIQ